MRMADIIEHKKIGKELSEDEIKFFVSGFTNGDIPDYQASALAMAIWFNKLNEKETAALTREMAKSGDMLNLSPLGNATADKHSSGGVGDKTTLIVAPIAAAAGVTVAKMSGRGLGFTGGTIDKLESIPKLSTQMTPDDFFKQAKDIGIVVAGQTGNMAPCDKKLYALRDVTATVDCMGLIASSIMSKKLASGAKSIVLDVKCGNGAFMKDEKSAVELATEMVKIGKNCDRNICAYATDMNAPLGYCIGNTLEVIEAIEILKGKKVDDLAYLSINLASEMIALALNKDIDTAKNIAQEMLDSGKAYKKLCEMVKAQGGDISYLENTDKFKKAHHKLKITAQKSGYISDINALLLGTSCVTLGAGRNVKTDCIDKEAGIVLNAKPGDKIEQGETVLTIYSNNKSKIDMAKEDIASAITITDEKPQKSKLIIKVVH